MRPEDAVMVTNPRAIGIALRTGELRSEHLNPPDPRKPVAVCRPTAVRFEGLGPGETPIVYATGEILRWVRDRRQQREARRKRMARKQRRGWA
jgi:hypothetical protein